MYYRNATSTISVERRRDVAKQSRDLGLRMTSALLFAMSFIGDLYVAEWSHACNCHELDDIVDSMVGRTADELVGDGAWWVMDKWMSTPKKTII